MKIRLKKQLSLIMVLSLVLGLMPLSAFAGETLQLNDVERVVTVNTDEYRGQDEAKKAVFLYVPIADFLGSKSQNDLEKGIEENELKLKGSIRLTFATTSGKEIVRSSSYQEPKEWWNTVINNELDLKKAAKEAAKEAYGDGPDIFKYVTSQLGETAEDEVLKAELAKYRFGYLKIRMSGKGGAGIVSYMTVSFNFKSDYFEVGNANLAIVLGENPSDKPNAVETPRNPKWRGDSGVAEWDTVKGGSYENLNLHKYKVTILRKRGAIADTFYSEVVEVHAKDDEGKDRASRDFSRIIEGNPGTYVFRVAAMGESKDEDQPEGNWSAQSNEFVYKLPRTEIGDASNLMWSYDSANIIVTGWNNPKGGKQTGMTDKDHYELYLYHRAPNAKEDGVLIGPKVENGKVKPFILDYSSKPAFDEPYKYIKDEYIKNKDPKDIDGDYFFRVKGISGRRLEILDGEMSKLSNILKIEDGVISIDGKSAPGKVNQSALKLKASPAKINVNKEAKLSVSGGSSKGAVEYRIVGGTGAGVITKDILKATKPGIIRVQATMKGLKVKDKDYNDVDSNVLEILVEVAPVDLEIKTEGNSAVVVIPDEKVNELINTAPFQEHGSAVISVGNKGNISSAALPVKALEKLAKSSKVNGITVAFPKNMKVRLDSKALDSVLDQARGDYIVFAAKAIKANDKNITDQQRAYLNKEKPAAIFDISLSSDGRMLFTSSTSNRGTIYFHAPYSSKDITMQPDAFYLDSKGYADLIDSEYDLDDKTVIMELDHLSIYFIKEGTASSDVKVNFITNGGSTIKTLIEKRGERIYLDDYTTNRTGYIFDGWYADSDLTNEISSLYLSTDVNVFAKWIPMHSYSGFVDVPYNAWYYSAIETMLDRDIMGGVSGDRFAPSTATTRGMIVTILHRLEGSPEVKKSSKFSDVKENAYYKNAVAWASANKIVQGYGSNQYGPNDPITREQMAAILRNYSAYKKYDVSASARISQFKDFTRVSSYAVASIEWAVGEEIIGGKGNGLLDPRGKATRAEVASIFQRYVEKFS